jgi:hypothetical protein
VAQRAALAAVERARLARLVAAQHLVPGAGGREAERGDVLPNIATT